jgi:hypothetical protein
MEFHLVLSSMFGLDFGVFKLITRTVRTFSEAKGKYQDISFDFRENFLPLSRKTGEAMNRSDPAIPVHLG